MIIQVKAYHKLLPKYMKAYHKLLPKYMKA